jgi:hypothetical protein
VAVGAAVAAIVSRVDDSWPEKKPGHRPKTGGA